MMNNKEILDAIQTMVNWDLKRLDKIERDELANAIKKLKNVEYS